MARRPNYPFVSHFRNLHKSQPIVVLGLGESTTSLPSTYYDKFTTIGVNDINRFYDPTYTICIDSPTGLDKDHTPGSRSKWVQQAAAPDHPTTCLFTHPKRWLNVLPDALTSPKIWQLATEPPWPWTDPRHTSSPPDYTRHFSGKGMPRGPWMPMWCCSPHLAIHFAAFLGASAIAMIGVDLSPDRFFERTNRQHGLADKLTEMNHIFGTTHESLKDELDIPLYNISSISQIVSVPYLSPQAFEEQHLEPPQVPEA